MFTDLLGKRRLKVGLHTHTTISDGRRSPEEVIALYKEAGYDALALTDHWYFGPGGEREGLTILSGCEYNVEGVDPETGVCEYYHIVGLGMTRDPQVPETYRPGQSGCDHDGHVRDRVRDIVARIREAGGLAVLAHPAWCLNTPEQIMGSGDFDATEIYNSVSAWEMSDRPYSGLIIDQVAACGVTMPLLATDDAHYYDGDQCRGWVAVEADAARDLGLLEAIRRGCFYATMGPEVHLTRLSPTTVELVCSPAVKVAFLSNSVWSMGRMVRGENITRAVYELKSHERFLRVEVTDAQGRMGFSNILSV